MSNDHLEDTSLNQKNYFGFLLIFFGHTFKTISCHILVWVDNFGRIDHLDSTDLNLVLPSSDSHHLDVTYGDSDTPIKYLWDLP